MERGRGNLLNDLPRIRIGNWRRDGSKMRNIGHQPAKRVLERDLESERQIDDSEWGHTVKKEPNFIVTPPEVTPLRRQPTRSCADQILPAYWGRVEAPRTSPDVGAQPLKFPSAHQVATGRPGAAPTRNPAAVTLTGP